MGGEGAVGVVGVAGGDGPGLVGEQAGGAVLVVLVVQDDAGEEVFSPLAIPADGIGDFIVLAAQAVEMQLIEDHTRQQGAPEGAPIDSSQDLHWVVMPFAHPEEYTSFIRKQGASDPSQ